MIFNKSLIASAILLVTLAAGSSAAPTKKPAAKAKATIGQTGAIISQTDFCLFLPPKYGGGIAENEDRA
ncbi:hypothetical protein BGW38_007982, partial [Lunasporangiospora selenospora]